MRACSFLIAFFSILSCHAIPNALQNCVRSSAGSCMAYDNGVESIHLVGSEDKSIRLTFGNHYLAQELNHYRMEGILPTRFFGFATCLEWFGYELYNIFSLRSAFGKQISKDWSVGFNLSLRSLAYEGITHRKALLVCDLFTNYHGESPHEFYGKAENLFGAGIRCGDGEFITDKRAITIGWLTHFSESVSCALECHWGKEKDWEAHFGTEYVMEHLKLRCGASGPPIVPSFGVGLGKEKFTLDFSARWVRNLGYVLDCGISYLFK